MKNRHLGALQVQATRLPQVCNSGHARIHNYLRFSPEQRISDSSVTLLTESINAAQLRTSSGLGTDQLLCARPSYLETTSCFRTSVTGGVFSVLSASNDLTRKLFAFSHISKVHVSVNKLPCVVNQIYITRTVSVIRLMNGGRQC